MAWAGESPLLWGLRAGLSTPASLVVTVSNAVSADGDGGGAYAMAKLADDRLALTAALQLKEHKVASVAVH